MIKILIPESHFIGIRYDRVDANGIPLAFMTPHGTTKADLKRQETVRGWARPTNRDDAKPPKFDVLTNELISGFQISREVQRTGGWGGSGNVKWRIEDPRGFELEISSHNMAKILECTTITNGVIQGKCIWGRGGGDNILLPEMSQPYRDAVKTTTMHTDTVKLADVGVGDLVELSDGSTLMFMGLFRFMCRVGTYRSSHVGDLFKVVKRYAFKNPDTQKYTLLGSVKIHRVINAMDVPISRVRLLTELNEVLAQNPGRVVEFSSTDCTLPVFASLDTKLSVRDMSIEFRDISYDDACDKNYPIRESNNPMLYLTDTVDDKMYVVSQYSLDWFRQHDKFGSDAFSMRNTSFEGRGVTINLDDYTASIFNTAVPSSQRYLFYGNTTSSTRSFSTYQPDQYKLSRLVCINQGIEYNAC